MVWGFVHDLWGRSHLTRILIHTNTAKPATRTGYFALENYAVLDFRIAAEAVNLDTFATIGAIAHPSCRAFCQSSRCAVVFHGFLL